MSTIRPAHFDDAVSINAIRNFYIRTSTANLEYREMPDPEFANLLRGRDEKTPFFAVERNGKVVGYGSLSYFGDKPGYRITAEIGLYLTPETHGGGIGRKLLDHLLMEARRLGFHSVLSRITFENTVSIHLHERAGFTRVGTLKEVGRKFDRFVDVYFYQKNLS